MTAPESFAHGPAEIKALRDLTGLLALPALWVSKDRDDVLQLMAEAIDSMMAINSVLVQLRLPEGGEEFYFLECGTACSPSKAIAPEWLPFAQACLRIAHQAGPSTTLESPSGVLQVVRFEMRAGSQHARIWFASRQAAFPTGAELTLMRAAVSLAGTGLAAAHVDEERRQAHRAKDEFLAMLGHELRNPLAPIVTALHLIRAKGSGHLDREHAVIERQVGHLSRLVEDLLDVTRITRDKVHLNKQIFDIQLAVSSALEAVAPLLEHRKQSIQVDVQPGIQVDGDVARIRQIISNLLVNAAKYAQILGHIDLTVSAVSGQARIVIQDNGSGIDKILISRIFELFEQGPTTIDRAGGGLGIGLAIVKKLVTLHSGTVTASSEGVGKGSRFTVQLPLVEHHLAADTTTRELLVGQEAAAGRRVLIVDDNVDALETLEQFLQLYGFEVTTAKGPTEALEKAPAFKPEALVLDLGLPGMDGYQLASELRRQLGDSALNATFIALTGYGQPSDKARTAAAGFHHHLVKPVDGDELITVLQSMN